MMPLDKQNYRPICILPFISKRYERSLNTQLSIHYDTIFNPFIGAFRQGMGCQSTLLRMVEDWRNALDICQYAAAIMMDLSKAFDCIPHDLLIGKLRAYGLSVKACTLVSSYKSDLKHTVQLGRHYSEWSNITKGVPQGSIRGRLLFNVFINDIFHALGRSSLYNYADDNTLSYAHHNAETVILTLQQDCSSLLGWFHENQMKVHPHKCQAISFDKRGNGVITGFKCGMTQVKYEDYVVLLGIEIDHMLTFNDHNTDMCKKSARQLAVLKRLDNLLTLQGKVAIFKSFISSNLNFCPLIWHICSQCNTNKLEKVQERALRIVYNDHICLLMPIFSRPLGSGTFI